MSEKLNKQEELFPVLESDIAEMRKRITASLKKRKGFAGRDEIAGAVAERYQALLQDAAVTDHVPALTEDQTESELTGEEEVK